jgi:hypothetical protein
MYKAKFAIIMTSDKYWDPNSPCREEVEAILQRGLKIFILRIDATCSTCMRGDFLGTSEDEIDSAGFLKSRLGALNCFPPPHKPLFQVREAPPHVLRVPGVITHIQPNIPEAKVRGSQEGFQCTLVSQERVPGVRKGVRRGPVGPPGPLELAAGLHAPRL